MTIAEASRATAISRPAVRRCLHTLERLGYAARSGTTYRLRPKVLFLGYAYLSSSTLSATAQPLLDQLRDQLRESCSLGVMEEDEVVYVARAEISRVVAVALRVGSRLPLYCTSMGRVLLAGRTREERDAYFDRADLPALTPRTRTDPGDLRALLEQVAEEGYALVDGELEPGLRSIAVPVRSSGGVIAALNVGVAAARVTTSQLRSGYLPVLKHAARDLALAVAT